MADKLKRLPYGMTDFATIRCENCFYVDKTEFIPKLEDVRFALFLRPRRFGKSLFTNMLKAYYDINYADRFDNLFGDLAIGKDPTELHNTYLVLSFNFSTVRSSPEQAQDSFNNIALEQIGNFIRDYESILPADTRRNVMECGLDCAEALLKISDICRRAGQKIYLMIDEYDNFANTLASVDQDSYQKILHADGFIRYFYNVIKAATTENNAALDRIYITGVSPLCLSDITSGFNIAANLSTDPRFNAMVGFSEDEVRKMLEYYSPALGDAPDLEGKLLPAVKSYYDNYCFSEDSAEEGEHLFNSDMTLYFIDKCISRKGKIPKTLLDPNVRQDYKHNSDHPQRRICGGGDYSGVPNSRADGHPQPHQYAILPRLADLWNQPGRLARPRSSQRSYEATVWGIPLDMLRQCLAMAHRCDENGQAVV